MHSIQICHRPHLVQRCGSARERKRDRGKNLRCHVKQESYDFTQLIVHSM